MFWNIAALLALLALIIGSAGVAWYYKNVATLAKASAERAEQRAKDALNSTANKDNSTRATIKGQIAEQLAPLLPGFPYMPSDFRFLGAPIDFVVFVGLTEAKEGLGDIEEVVLGDIKMGGAKLSSHQKMIKRAVEDGRVRWVTLHVDPEFFLTER